jgi:Ca2+-transporting ATPase
MLQLLTSSSLLKIGTAMQKWYALDIEHVTQHLHTDLQAGLTEAEAQRRLQQYGANELQGNGRLSPWTILLEQCKNILILILLLAVGLSASLGHTVEALAIAVIVLFAVLLGFIQEYRAERAIEALRQMAAPSAMVIRGGRETSIPARHLVPGDVILLQTGDKIPADGRLTRSINLQVEEAALTGESVPVEKQTEPLGTGNLAIGDRNNMVYSGTTVTYGRGWAVVVATAMQTEFGQIAQLLQGVETTPTPLQENLHRVGVVLARAALAIVAIIVALGLFRGQPFIDMLIFGIALAVAVVPEALPAVVTISLAIGVQRMVKRNALVRRLPAVETLGSTSVICSDKTGTLTKDEMTARRIYVAGCTMDISGVGYAPEGAFLQNGAVIEPAQFPPLLTLLQAATLASDAHIESDADNRWQVKGDPTEGALVVAAAKAGLGKTDLDAQCPRLHEIPFTSESKRMTTLAQTPSGVVAYAKGAPEVIVDACTARLTDHGIMPLPAADREQILDVARDMARQALRVLGIAYKPQATVEEAERDMTLLGLVGMSDPPRPEAQAAMRTCEQAGIKVVMITGDHPLTAEGVARELGLLKQGRVLVGSALEDMSQEAFEHEVEDIEVYARVSPMHKLRVVTALQKHGHIVAMTGDGVNDAPALKKADIGIAMGITGTDVTKEAAAMLLLDDNFASIVAAVEEGRGIFGNIKKYLMYLLSSNIGEILLMTVASLLGLPLPLTAVQILYINLATDGLPALALAVDPPEADLMQRQPRTPRSGIFTKPVVGLMLVGGVWLALANLGLFVWASHTGRSSAEAMTMTFVSVVLFEFVKAYNFRSDRHSVFTRPLANKWLNLAIIWELLLLTCIVYLPVLHAPFNTYSLPPIDWAIVLALALSVVLVLEIAKWTIRRQGRLSRGT